MLSGGYFFQGYNKFYEACLNEADARRRERYLKSGMGKKYLNNRLKSYLENL